MVSMNVEKLGELSVVECDGRIVRSDAAFALRDSITSQVDARVIVLDLSEVNALEGGGLGMLMFLQRWARDHHIQLKLFNPRGFVRARLERTESAASKIYVWKIYSESEEATMRLALCGFALLLANLGFSQQPTQPPPYSTPPTFPAAPQMPPNQKAPAPQALTTTEVEQQIQEHFNAEPALANRLLRTQT